MPEYLVTYKDAEIPAEDYPGFAAAVKNIIERDEGVRVTESGLQLRLVVDGEISAEVLERFRTPKSLIEDIVKVSD